MNEHSNIGIKDIARLAQVSIGTVDRVLHNRGGVAPATLRRVREVIEKHGYQKNIYASRLNLASRKKIVLAALIPEIDNPSNYWQLHLNGLNRALKELSELGVVLRIFHFKFLEEESYLERLNYILQSELSGLITVPTSGQTSTYLLDAIKNLDIQLAYLDIKGRFGNYSIYQNAHEAGTVAGRLMHGLLPDCQNLIIFHTSRRGRINANSQERAQGFRHFFTTISKEVQFRTIHHRLEDEGSLDATLREHLPESKETGLFVTNSRSYLVCDHLLKRYLRNIRVVGFDLNSRNVAHLRAERIQFLINQKPEFQSYCSVKFLYESIVQTTLVEAGSEHIRIPVEIVIPENVDQYLNSSDFAV